MGAESLDIDLILTPALPLKGREKYSSSIKLALMGVGRNDNSGGYLFSNEAKTFCAKSPAACIGLARISFSFSATIKNKPSMARLVM